VIRDPKVLRLRIVTLLLLALRAATSRADSAVRLTLGAAYWRALPSGTTTITRGGQAGSGARIDMADDLDLGAANVAEVSIDGELGGHRFGASYEPLGFDGETTTSRTLRFHGATIPAQTRLRSEVGLRLVMPRYDYALLDGPAAELRAGLLAYIWTFDAQLRGATAAGSIDESRRFTHVLPAVTLSGGLPLAGWELAARSAFGVLASDRYALDFSPELRRRLWDRWTLAVGYRWLELVFHETTNRGDLTAQGPFVSVSLDVMAPPASSTR